MTATQNLSRHGTLVWIDAREAVIVRWANDEATIERHLSDVPARHRSTGHVRHDPATRHGGGGDAPHDAGEGRRIEHLNQFVEFVATNLAGDDDVVLIGPGQVREFLAARLPEAHQGTNRERTITVHAAARRTDPQLVAQLRAHLLASPRRVPVAG